jgi:cell wall-associated NlpC family hydrolase
MNHRRLLTLCMAAALLCSGLPVSTQAPKAPSPVDEALVAVKTKFAPDRRLAVFDVTTESEPGGIVVRGEVESAQARDAAILAVRGAGFAQVTDKIVVLPDPALGSETFGIVRVSVANVRTRASHPAEMGTQTIMGWTVQVLKKQSGWYFVHTDPDGYLGWIEELQLTLMSAAGKAAWEAAPRVITTTPVSFVRVAADRTSEPVTDLVVGSILKRIGASGAWTSVALADGRKGFVSTDDLQDYAEWKASRKPSADLIERTALQFMGVPYLWGGTSSKGFDCSGFAKTVLRLNGIELPRDTDQQAEAGIEIPFADGLSRLQKGDLLFFGTRASADRPERVSHVGIHVGNLDFIHASGLVRRNSLDPVSPIYSESLRNRLLHVRRVLK